MNTDPYHPHLVNAESGHHDRDVRQQRARFQAESSASADLKASLAVAQGSAISSPTALVHAGYAAVARRLYQAYGHPMAGSKPVFAQAADGHLQLITTPRITRSSMAPERWSGGFVRRVLRMPIKLLTGGHARHTDANTDAPAPRHAWKWVGRWRRTVLLILVLAQTWIATRFMTAVLPYHGTTVLEIATLVVYALLFAWISFGFWTAMMGFVSLLFRRDRYAIARDTPTTTSIPADARTAIVMPICNEDVARVFAGLRATYESVKRRDALEHFDFFVLSDSGDPDMRVAELDAWQRLCRAMDGFGHIFYRHRAHHIKRKSGNIADFCRRWGKSYRYMVVLDADSVMSGTCLTRLVQIMEAHPNAGVVQTVPHSAGHDTLYARMQQFASRVYGPLFTAGLHFWQLGESHYWGHNAIIRVAPFIRHCALRRLPGRGALSGEILSHDFVEAALMRKAGWSVWIAYDLEGSYEDMPPNLLDELKRDRRWCQGNLMNSRLVLAKGLHTAHRAIFMTGVMAYLSAPIWFAFLLLSTALLITSTLWPATYFTQPYQLFPVWPQWHPDWAITLFTATVALLFLPKVLAVLLIIAKGARSYGGAFRLMLSMLLEFVFSAALAPIRMLFHSRFVLTSLAGIATKWRSPQRDSHQTSWRTALARHGVGTAVGCAWAIGVYLVNPGYLAWLAPVVGALIASVPLSVYSSWRSLGRTARRAGMFLIPEETMPPPELAATAQHVANTPPVPDFAAAATDPALNALLCANGKPRRKRQAGSSTERALLLEHIRNGGLTQLDRATRNRLLDDPLTLSEVYLTLRPRPSLVA